jgi:hypothetical protein
LIDYFGIDNCYGLAWTLMHLVETAPTFRISVEPPTGTNSQIARPVETRCQASLASSHGPRQAEPMHDISSAASRAFGRVTASDCADER